MKKKISKKKACKKISKEHEPNLLLVQILLAEAKEPIRPEILAMKNLSFSQ